MAAGELRVAGDHPAEHDLRDLVLRAQRPLLRRSVLPRKGRGEPVAAARDAAGDRPAPSGVTVAVFNADTVPPAVSISSPANAATVHGAVSVVAAASDNQGLSGVQFMVDGALVGSELNAPPYTMTWD